MVHESEVGGIEIVSISFSTWLSAACAQRFACTRLDRILDSDDEFGSWAIGIKDKMADKAKVSDDLGQ